MKILKSLFVLLFFISLASPVNAQESISQINIADNNEPIDFEAYLNYEKIGTLYNLFTPFVACSDTACVTETISISGLTKYFQDGQTWSNNLMQTCSLSINSSGCAVTSLAMIANKYTTDRNPGQLNTLLGVDACPMKWANAAIKLGLTKEIIYSNNTGGVDMSSVKNSILGALRLGRPVLLGMEYIKDDKKANHYIVVRNYIGMSDGTYSFGIYDPSITKNYSSLKQYMDIGYKVIQLIVYY